MKFGMEFFNRFVIRPSISIGKMREMSKSVEAISQQLGLRVGYFYVTGRHGIIKLHKKFGDDAPPELRDVAKGKLKTTRRRHRSTFLVGETLRSQNIQPQDYGRNAPNIVPGGVAVFENGKFVGAVAVAGGHALNQDQELARQVIEKVGYTTDLPNKD